MAVIFPRGVTCVKFNCCHMKAQALRYSDSRRAFLNEMNLQMAWYNLSVSQCKNVSEDVVSTLNQEFM